MKVRGHVSLFVQAVVAWGVFWLLGLPSYYQQYSPVALGVGCTLLSVVISLFALYVLSLGSSETRLSRATWIAFYYTVPLALLDALYCGVYLGHGVSYLLKYWYLTVFYLTPWLTFLPTALLLRARPSAQR